MQGPNQPVLGMLAQSGCPESGETFLTATLKGNGSAEDFIY